MSGMTYIEVAGTGEKRQHTEASLLNRMAAIQSKGSKDQAVKDAAVKDAKKNLVLIQKGEIVDLTRATFRNPSIGLDDLRFILQALETGAWGKVVPSV